MATLSTLPRLQFLVLSRFPFPLLFVGGSATAISAPPLAARHFLPPSEGYLPPANVVIVLLFLHFRIAVLVIVGVAVHNALVDPIDTVNPANLAVLFWCNMSLFRVALQGAPNPLPTFADSSIMPLPL